MLVAEGLPLAAGLPAVTFGKASTQYTAMPAEVITIVIFLPHTLANKANGLK